MIRQGHIFLQRISSSGIGHENYLCIDIGDALLPKLIENTLGLNFTHYVIDQSWITGQQRVGQA